MKQMSSEVPRVIDLTQPIADSMSVYPGDPSVSVVEVARREIEGYSVSAIHLNDHAGTHVETQHHMVAGKYLSDEPLERLIAHATVIGVAVPRIEIRDLLTVEAAIRRNPFILLHTGYSERVPRIDPDDPNRPIVSLPALKWLCDRGMTLLGIDAFDFDAGPPYLGHRLLFERGVLVVEGLVGLESLVGREVTLFVVPLKVVGTGASPCRVLALLDR